MVEPTKEEINDVLNKCSEHENAGTSEFRGMSYEQGVLYTILWFTEDAENPLK